MAKASIIIEDSKAGVDIRVVFDPPYENGGKPTAAQAMAYEVAKLLSGNEGTPEDEDNG